MQLKLIMPSEGDMELVKQDGGAIILDPIFYGSNSMGPHVQVVDDNGTVVGRYKLVISTNEKVRLERQKAGEE